jgi:hypothetical protein
VRFKGFRTQFSVDLYNALNANPTQTYQQTFIIPAPSTGSSSWLAPQGILPAGLRSSRRSSISRSPEGSMKSLNIAVVLCLLAAAVAPAAAQDSKKFSPPKTPWGEPDLQGTYSNRTITPFERPANVNGREFFTKEEVAGSSRAAQQQSGDEGRTKGSRQDVERAYNDFWWDRGTKVTTPRTSLVVEPADGKVPAQTDAAKARAADEGKRPAFRGAGAAGRGTDTWLDRSTFERCITRGMPGAMSPTPTTTTTASRRVPDSSRSRSRCWAVRA